jgi:hypothetical protein
MKGTYRSIRIYALALAVLGACSDDDNDDGTGTDGTSGHGGTETSDGEGSGSDDGGATESETSTGGGGSSTTTGGSTSATGTTTSAATTGSSTGAGCVEAGGMCVVGSEPQDCPNGMGTSDASLTYPCDGLDEQCCVPVAWECHVPPDCFFQEWRIYTQGHWRCEGNVCLEVSDICEDPPVPPCCGDADCDDSYGENEQSCIADCT